MSTAETVLLGGALFVFIGAWVLLLHLLGLVVYGPRGRG